MTDGIIQQVIKQKREGLNMSSPIDFRIDRILFSIEQELIKKIRVYHSEVTEYTGLILKSDLIGDSKE